MDKGLTDLLSEIRDKLHETVANLAIGGFDGAGSEVRLDNAIANCNPKGIKAAIEEGATSRRVTDLIMDNLRMATNPEDAARLSTTQAILDCQDLLDKDKKFEQGHGLHLAINSNSPSQLKLIAKALQNQKIDINNLDSRLYSKLENVIDEDKSEMFQAIAESNIIKASWVTPLLSKTLSSQKMDMFKSLVKNTKDITTSNTHSILIATEKEFSKNQNDEFKDAIKSVLSYYPKDSLKEISQNKDNKWSEITATISKNILTKKEQKLSHAEMWGRGGPI